MALLLRAYFVEFPRDVSKHRDRQSWSVRRERLIANRAIGLPLQVAFVVRENLAVRSNGDTVYERRNNTDSIVETANFTGAPLAILPLGTDFLIITDQGSPAFTQHIPTGP